MAHGGAVAGGERDGAGRDRGQPAGGQRRRRRSGWPASGHGVCLVAACFMLDGCDRGPASAPGPTPGHATAADRGAGGRSAPSSRPPVQEELLDESALIRFLGFLPLLIDRLQEAERAGSWRVELRPHQDPQQQPEFWARFGPYIKERFGEGFEATWLRTWAAYAVVEGEALVARQVEAMQNRLREPQLSAEERRDLEARLRALQEGTAPPLDLAGRIPAGNIRLVRAHQERLREIYTQLFKRP